MYRPGTICLALLVCLACDDGAAARRQGATREAAVRWLAAQATAERQAFWRLPACPAPERLPPGARATWRPVVADMLWLPPEFTHDTLTRLGYIHGGSCYRAGTFELDVYGGHFGWPSLDPGRSYQLPGGCRFGDRLPAYVVVERADTIAGQTVALATRLDSMMSGDADFPQLYGCTSVSLRGPGSMRPRLLQIVAESTERDSLTLRCS